MRSFLVFTVGVLLMEGIRPVRPECAADEPQRPSVKLTISESTTVLTGPLTDNGQVDYMRAVDEMLGERVSPLHNAMVLLAQAYGPGALRPEYRASYCRRLGINLLPEQGHYLTDLDGFAITPPGVSNEDWSETLQQQLKTAMSRAWGREEFPVLANWIEANAVPLERVREAVARRQFYSPLQYVPGEPALLKAVLQTYMQEFRVTSRLLVARALLALGKEEVEAGWADLHAAHRLARLIAHGPTHIDALLCVAIEEQVFRAAVVMLDRFRLTDQQARRCLQDLQLLPPAARMADVIDNSERYAFLQIVSIIATDKEGPDSLYTFLNDPPADDPIRTIYPAAAELVDWSEVLRLGNAWFDRIVAAMRRPTRVERVDALWRNLTTELNAPTSHGRLTRRFVNELKEQHPQKLAHSFSQLMAVLFLLPFQALQDAEDSAGTRCDLLRIAFGLAAYRADHGAYPGGLNALVPHYVASVPGDLFSAQPFVYRTEGVGYLLYSVGVDAEDDGGRSRDDEPAGDDNAIRVTHRTE